MTVIVMTEEPLLEAGIRWILGQRPEFDLRGCRTFQELVRAVSENKPDVVLWALGPETDLAIAELRLASPRSAIVVWGRDIDLELAHQAIDMGVRGFIDSRVEAGVLAECLAAVARGELWMEKSLSMRLLDSRPVSLTRRQSQIVRLLSQGLANKEIAEALGIAESTVKSYLTVLFEKVGAKDRVELALFGLRNLKGVKDEAQFPRLRLTDRMRSPMPRRAAKGSLA
jgi:two-component system, NarL family, nitrate/nitrite response regulator NarL